MSLKSGFRALKWTSLSELIPRVIGIVVSVLSIRILEPQHFGVYGVAFSFMSLYNSYINFGFFSAIINKKELQSDSYKNLAWTIETFIFNILSAIFLFITSFYIDNYLQYDYAIGKYLRVISLIPLIRSLQNYYNIELQISLDFKRLFQLKLLPGIFKNLSSLYLLFLLRNIWALIIPEIVSVFSLVFLSYYWFPKSPRFYFSLHKFRKLYNFGKNLQLSIIFKQLRTSLEKIILGKVLGISNLGTFQVGEKIGNQISSLYIGVVNKALYPVISKNVTITNEKISAITQFLIELIFLVLFPIVLIANFHSKEIILFLFGEKWAKSEIIFKIFLFIASFRILNNTLNVEIRGKGKPSVEAWSNAINFFLFLFFTLTFYFWKVGFLFQQIAFAFLLIEIIQLIHLLLKIFGKSSIQELFRLIPVFCLILFSFINYNFSNWALLTLITLYTLIIIQTHPNSIIKSILKSKFLKNES